MTPIEAARLLELAPDATPEQIEARFLDLRRKLEDRIAKAPTPGLQAKYRESLAAITTAFEILTLAADGSALPVLKKETGSGRPEAGGPSSPQAASPDSGLRSQVSGLPTKPKTSSKEFLIVTFIAVAALAAGGWFILHTRAENAEQSRLAVAARAAADQAAEEQRLAATAEQQRQAEALRQADQAKALAAAAAKAEQDRREKILVTARVQLAEAKLAWSEFEAGTRRAERDATEARADRRALRDAPPGETARAEAREAAASDYADWTATQLTSHPARRSLVRLEEQINSRDAEAAEAELVQLQGALRQLEQDIDRADRTLRSITGSLQLTAAPGTFQWELRDAFGRTQRGLTPATADGVGVGRAVVRFTREGWPAREETVTIRRGEAVTLAANHPVGRLELKTEPAGMHFTVVDTLQRRFTGTTPATLEEIAAGSAQVTLTAHGWTLAPRPVRIVPGETAPFAGTFQTGTLAIESTPAGAEVYLGNRKLGVTPLTLAEVPVGRHSLQLRKADYLPVDASAEVPAAGTATLRQELVSSLAEADYPVVYFYRLKQVYGMAAKMHIDVNEQRLFTLGNGSYQGIRLKPGRYRFTADPGTWGQKSTTREVNIEPRTRYYFQTFPSESLMSTSAMLKAVPEAEAQPLIAALTGNPAPRMISLAPHQASSPLRGE